MWALLLPSAFHVHINIIESEARSEFSSHSSRFSSDEASVQERKQKLLYRNLESVFCLSISKSQGEARNLDSARRYLDLEICPGSKIRGEARNMDSGWPEPVYGNCPVLQNPGRGVESGIWMTRAGSWKLFKYSQNSVSGSPGVVEPVPLLSFFLCLGNSETWKVETAITLPVPALHVCTFPARERPLQRCKAPGARNGLARARVAAARAAGGSASRRNKLASSPHRLMRGALKVALLFAAAVTFSAVMAVSADMLHRHFRTIGFALD